MQDERLRLLALWHGLRRDVDLLLEPLLSHGPVAVARVSAHLDELEAAVQRERAGFDAFRTACAARAAGTPVPRDELAAGRARGRSVSSMIWTEDLAEDATVLQLPDRAPH